MYSPNLLREYKLAKLYNEWTENGLEAQSDTLTNTEWGKNSELMWWLLLLLLYNIHRNDTALVNKMQLEWKTKIPREYTIPP